MNAPARQSMLLNEVVASPGFVMKQKNSECCKCLCCQPNMQWSLHDYKEQFRVEEEWPIRYTMLEESSQCGRACSFCMPAHRTSKYFMFQGDVNMPANGQASSLVGQHPVIMTHEKNCTCGVNMFLCFGQNGEQIRVPCCANLPYLTTRDASNNVIATTRVICQPCVCVPKFTLENSQGRVTHMISPDTCCGGMCVACQCGSGASTVRIPFFIRDISNTYMHLDNDAKISDMWSGLKKECCTRQNWYQIKYPAPDDRTAHRNIDIVSLRAGMIGAALLIDMALFEQQ